MLFRPPEYLEDVRERELEIKAMEKRLARRDLHCPVCRAEVDADVPRLPGLHDEAASRRASNCKQPLEALWQICPYCETPRRDAGDDRLLAATRSRSRRRREAAPSSR